MDQQSFDLVKEAADRWFKENHPLDIRLRDFRHGFRSTVHVWQSIADMGWLGLSHAESAGGFGATMEQRLELIRFAGRDARPEPLMLHLMIAPLIAKEVPELTMGLMDGSVRLALADMNAIDNAPYEKEGAIFGRCEAVLGGDDCTHLIIPLLLDGQLSKTVIVALTDTKLKSLSCRLIDGRHTRQFEFDGLKADILAKPEHRVRFTQQVMDAAAAGLVADAAGAFETAFELTLDYLKQRYQFGQPLSAQQTTQHRMAEIFCDLQQLLSLLQRMGQEFDSQLSVDNYTLPIAKNYIGRRALRAMGQLIQLSGGIGMTEEYRLGHFYKRMHICAAFYGDAEYQLDRIDARQTLLNS